jgi:uncharacterized damage-inducible protein DinB
MNNDQKIDILAAVPAEAGSAFAALDDESARRPLDDGWTPLEILGHLKDAAAVYDERCRRVASEDNPYMLAYNQEEAVARAGYNSARPDELLSSIAASRAATIELLRSLDDSAFARPGVHEEEGPVTLQWLVDHMIEHETDHIADIRRAAPS